MPDGVDHSLFPVRHLHPKRAFRADDEARPVEHDLILPADAVEISKRNAGIDRAALGDAVDAQLVLVDLVRAAVDAQEDIRALRCQMAADFGLPDILADRQAQHDALERHRLGQRAGQEIALLVEGAIVGQFHLEAHRRYFALIEQRHAVVQGPVAHENRADQHRRSAVSRRRRQRLDRDSGALDQRGLQDQVLRRIADQLHLGIDDEVDALGPLPDSEHRRRVGGKIADFLIELSKRYDECIGHAHDPMRHWQTSSRATLGAKPRG